MIDSEITFTDSVAAYHHLFEKGFDAYAKTTLIRNRSFAVFKEHSMALAKIAVRETEGTEYLAALMEFEKLIEDRCGDGPCEVRGIRTLARLGLEDLVPTFNLLKPAVEIKAFRQRFYKLMDKFTGYNTDLLAVFSPELLLFGYQAREFNSDFLSLKDEETFLAAWDGLVMMEVRRNYQTAIEDLEAKTQTNYRKECRAEGRLLLGFEYYGCLMKKWALKSGPPI